MKLDYRISGILVEAYHKEQKYGIPDDIAMFMAIKEILMPKIENAIEEAVEELRGNEDCYWESRMEDAIQDAEEDATFNTEQNIAKWIKNHPEATREEILEFILDSSYDR